MKPYPFMVQLSWLQRLAHKATTAELRLMALSVAESVKVARDHAMNCPDDKARKY